MPEGDGYGDFGGGGSVKYEVKIGDGTGRTTPPQNPGNPNERARRVAEGVDHYDSPPNPTGYFLVEVNPPASGEIQCKRVGQKLVLYFPVNQPAATPWQQIRVIWGSAATDPGGLKPITVIPE